MGKGFINDEFMEQLKHLSEDDKKWVLLLLCFLLAGEKGVQKVLDTIFETIESNKLEQKNEHKD